MSTLTQLILRIIILINKQSVYKPGSFLRFHSKRKKMKLLPAFALASTVSAGAGIAMLVGENFDRVVMHRDTRGYWDFPFGGEESYDKSHKVRLTNFSIFLK